MLGELKVSHVSHGPCTQQDNAFAMTQHFSRLGHTPFWHLCVPKGAEMTSLRGGETFAPLPAGFRRCYGRHCLNTTNYYAS